MIVARSLEQAAGFKPCALTIGNFDGVHRAPPVAAAAVETSRSAGLIRRS